ncbi:hypothetical protein [Streptomyces sp. NPDC050738]|uniref:hypothetical protein n=1 Tax=Streptomyces sp. NPDC050738 TaxID=3154744 RepID=UPI00342784E3
MDVTRLLEAARLLVPEEVAAEGDLTVNDVWEHLAHDEWEVGLGLLEELGDAHPLPAAFWESLAAAAQELRLERSTAWCHWRGYEARRGVIRADLTLLSATEGRRQTPFSGAGVMRPMWDIGNRTPDGDGPCLDIAALWGEFTPFLEPGGCYAVRLAPLDSAQWRHLRVGQVITMYEGRPVAGAATVTEVRWPRG